MAPQSGVPLGPDRVESVASHQVKYQGLVFNAPLSIGISARAGKTSPAEMASGSGLPCLDGMEPRHNIHEGGGEGRGGGTRSNLNLVLFMLSCWPLGMSLALFLAVSRPTFVLSVLNPLHLRIHSTCSIRLPHTVNLTYGGSRPTFHRIRVVIDNRCYCTSGGI